MKLAIDLLIVLTIIFTAFTGTKRGMVLIGLELISFAIASAVALSLYRPLGQVIKSYVGANLSLSNIIAFILIWVVVEILSALIQRVTVLKHLSRELQLSRVNQIGGALLNAVKTLFIFALVLLVFAGLPLTPDTKDAVTSAAVPSLILESSGQLQSLLQSGLGNDLNNTLNFFTLTNKPESEERIDLGFTVKTDKFSSKAEDAMLVLVNNDRTAQGLKPLALNLTLRAAARAYSREMFAGGYFSHIDASGHTPYDRLHAAGVEFNSAGENLALAPTVTLAYQGLINSPEHRANILSPNYGQIGIGIVDGGPYGLMVAQEFTD